MIIDLLQPLSEMQSPPPDSKRFPDFKSYENAVKLHEEFIKKSKGIQKAFDETKTEEEFQKEMEEFGFSYHEDEYCESEWCQKHEECLAIALECFQESFNKHFFSGLLQGQDKIIQLQLDGHDCEKIPPSWKNRTTKEGRMIEWCFLMEESLISQNLQETSFVELTKQKDIQKFCRSLYFLLQEILSQKKPSTKNKSVVSNFLKQNSVFDKELCQNHLKGLQTILSI